MQTENIKRRGAVKKLERRKLQKEITKLFARTEEGYDTDFRLKRLTKCSFNTVNENNHK